MLLADPNASCVSGLRNFSLKLKNHELLHMHNVAVEVA
jgi:hypothetical protein